jgi:spermidine synthase
MTPRAGAGSAAIYLGAASLLCQTVIIRELLSFVSGNELAAGLVLGSWLLWTALGSLAAPPFIRAAGSAASAVAILEVASGLLAPVMVAAVRTMPAWLGSSPGELAPGSAFLAATLLGPAPLCLTLGALFPAAAALAPAGPAAASRAVYLRECLAAAAAGLLFSFWLAGRVPGLGLALAVAAAGTLLAGLTAGRTWTRLAAVPAALLLLAGFAGAQRLSERLEALRWPGMEVATVAETPLALVTVTRLGRQHNVHQNGRFSFSLPDPPSVEELVDLPLAVHGRARRVLLLGGAWTGAVAEILKHPVERLDLVEQDDSLGRILAPFLDPGERAGLADPRLRLVFDDPRRFLRRSGAVYDLVVVAGPETESLLANRLLTREAFLEARDALSPGGVLAFGLASPPNHAEATVLARNASLHATLSTVFAGVSVTPLERTAFFASRSPAAVGLEPGRLAGYLAGIDGLGTLRPETVADRVPPARVAGTALQLAAVPWAPLNTDARPVVHLLGIAWWSDRLLGPGRVPVAWLPRLPIAAWGVLSLAALLLAAAIIPRGPSGNLRRSGLSMAATGFAVMVLEIAVMLRFQVVNGHLLRDIGLLAALVMLGLGTGSALAGLTGSRIRWGLAADLGLVAACLALAWQAGGGTAATATVEATLLYGMAFAAGIFGGMRFAAAVGSSGDGRFIYAADLAGSCLGALLAPLLLIPALGIPGALLGTAMVKGVTLLGGHPSGGGDSSTR